LYFSGQVANEKFPGQEIICIGGIFFLRYFNPAIIAPVDNGILTELPPVNAIRSFILISKMLQNIANNVKISSTTKEGFMNCIAHTIEENILKEQVFLNDLTKDLTPNTRKYDVSEDMFLRALQTFQKAFRNISNFQDTNTKFPLFHKMLQSVIMNLKDYSLGKETVPKDDLPIPIIIKRRENPCIPTLTNTMLMDGKLTMFIHLDSSVLILRPIRIAPYVDSHLDGALDALKACILKIIHHVQGVLDTLILGEDITAIGDENRRGNEIIGHLVRLQLAPILCKMFGDGIATEDTHVWGLLKKIAKSESLVKTLNTIDRDVRVDEVNMTNDVKFTYFICECIT
jgi:hypothetical protein